MIAALNYRDLHSGRDTGMVNAPERLAPNLHDFRLSPDSAARRDLLFRFRTRDGMLVAKPNGQVKVGSARYVADELTEMASSPGYGKVGDEHVSTNYLFVILVFSCYHSKMKIMEDQMEIMESQYARIAPHLPVQRGNAGLPNLQVINAILYMAEHGCKWRGFRERFGN